MKNLPPKSDPPQQTTARPPPQREDPSPRTTGAQKSRNISARTALRFQRRTAGSSCAPPPRTRTKFVSFRHKEQTRPTGANSRDPRTERTHFAGSRNRERPLFASPGFRGNRRRRRLLDHHHGERVLTRNRSRRSWASTCCSPSQARNSWCTMTLTSRGSPPCCSRAGDPNHQRRWRGPDATRATCPRKTTP